MSLPKTHTFNGLKYSIFIGDLDGNCDTDNKLWIVIERDLKERIGLETAIHEGLHACSWSKEEKIVGKVAHDI
ncbi:hypothetical protein LCGC14_1982970, partial [marine sediment metagenome]